MSREPFLTALAEMVLGHVWGGKTKTSVLSVSLDEQRMRGTRFTARTDTPTQHASVNKCCALPQNSKIIDEKTQGFI